MSALDPRIKAVADKYGLQDGDFWELPQKKGTWIAKHSALEVAAVRARIAFDNPQVVEANSEAGLPVTQITDAEALSIGLAKGVLQRIVKGWEP